jgi:hypothetical protein
MGEAALVEDLCRLCASNGFLSHVPVAANKASLFLSSSNDASPGSLGTIAGKVHSFDTLSHFGDLLCTKGSAIFDPTHLRSCPCPKAAFLLGLEVVLQYTIPYSVKQSGSLAHHDPRSSRLCHKRAASAHNCRLRQGLCLAPLNCCSKWTAVDKSESSKYHLFQSL